MKTIRCGRIFVAAFLAITLSACSGGARTAVPSAPGTLHTAPQGRHNSALAYHPSDTSPCGTCSCGYDADGNMIPIMDDYPCQGGGDGTGPMGGAPGGGTVVDNTPGAEPPLPPQVDCNANPTDPTCQLAVTPGIPNGPCTQSDLTNSLPVGASLGPVNKNGVSTVRSVVDINQVNAISSSQIVNPKMVAGSWKSIGWLYLDDAGGLWFQKDPAAQWTIAINVNVNQYFGIAITPPVAQNSYYIANHPTATPISNNLQTTKCFNKGRGLVPGTLAGPAGPPVS